MYKKKFKYEGYEFSALHTKPTINSSSFPTIFIGGVFHSKQSLTKHQLNLANQTETYWLELPGQGGADFLPAHHGFSFLVSCLNHFIDSMQFESCNVIASSYSTPIAIQFSSRFPEKLSSLVLAGTSKTIDNSIKSTLERGIDLSYAGGEVFAELSVNTLFNRKFGDLIPIQKRVMPSMKKLMLELSHSQRRVFRHNTRRLLNGTMGFSGIPVQPLIMSAQYDNFTPVDGALEVAKMYEGATVISVEKADHMMPIEKPKVVWGAGLEWIKNGNVDAIDGIRVIKNSNLSRSVTISANGSKGQKLCSFGELLGN